MRVDVFQRLVDEMAGWPFAFMRIVGLGEPALHPDFPALMEYLVAKRIKVELTTNGELLCRFSPEQIGRWPIDILGISIDGFDADSYRKCRPGGDYESLVRHVDQLYAFRRQCQEKLPLIKIRNVILPGTSSEVIAVFREFWGRRADTVAFNTYNPASRRSWDTETVRQRCRELFFLAHVRWDGRVPLCGYQFLFCEQEILGDVSVQSLESIWTNPRLAEMRRMHLARNYNGEHFCSGCFNTHARSTIEANYRRFNVAGGRLAGWINRLINIV